MSEKEQSWRHNSPRLRKILQSYPSQKCWYWHRNRHIDQWSRAESSKINPHTYSNPWMDLGMIILREFRQRKTNNISLICEILKQKWCKSIFTKQTVLFLVEHRYVTLVPGMSEAQGKGSGPLVPCLQYCWLLVNGFYPHGLGRRDKTCKQKYPTETELQT